MKTSLIVTATIACLGLAVASTFAQTQSTTSSTTTYVQTSKIVGTKVKSSQGEEIGVIKDVVLDRSTGCMAYTVLSTGGTGGSVAGGGKMVAVPWAVYSPTSNISELTVTVDRERIYSAPVFDYARIEEYSRPDYITNVYSYYGVSPGAAVGVGVSGSTTTTGATTTTGSTTTGATTAAGTTASPAGTSSPAATSSSPGAKSPLPATSASPARSPSPHATAATTPHAARGGRPHETVSPGTRGGATGTSPTEEKRGTRGTHEETTPPTGHSETGARSETQRPTSETERAPSEAASPGEKATGSRHRERPGKHEAGTPSERPPGED
jgi:sporulation protein YlmC with PRC-barrel domain